MSLKLLGWLWQKVYLHNIGIGFLFYCTFKNFDLSLWTDSVLAEVS